MPLAEQQKKRRYTNADYWSWSEDDRIEIIDGVAYCTYGGEIGEDSPVMQATPSQRHQDISHELIVQLHAYLKGKPCKLFHAPSAVALNADAGDNTTVEPDLFVVCDSSKLDGKKCNGAPDLVIEILSPSTARKDRVIKFQQYLDAGVREYWIVDPDTQYVQASILESGNYITKVYRETASAAPVSVLAGCTIDLREVFPTEPQPSQDA